MEQQKDGPSNEKLSNTRSLGAFLNPHRMVPGGVPRQQKVHLLSSNIPPTPPLPNPSQTDVVDAEMSWGAAEDRRLLLFGLERKMEFKDHVIIAKMFPEQPTAKAIQERIAKLRKEQNELLAASDIFRAAAAPTDPTSNRENKSILLSASVPKKKQPRRALSSIDRGLLHKEVYTNEELEELKGFFKGLIPEEVLEASHRELREMRERVLREESEKTKMATTLTEFAEKGSK